MRADVRRSFTEAIGLEEERGLVHAGAATRATTCSGPGSIFSVHGTNPSYVDLMPRLDGISAIVAAGRGLRRSPERGVVEALPAALSRFLARRR